MRFILVTEQIIVLSTKIITLLVLLINEQKMKLKPSSVAQLYLHYKCPKCGDLWMFDYKQVRIEGFAHPCSCGCIMRFNTMVKAKILFDYKDKTINKPVISPINYQEEKVRPSIYSKQVYKQNNLEQASLILKKQGYSIQQIQQMVLATKNINNNMEVSKIIKELLKTIK